MKRPLAIDLFCGLSGWGEGLIAEGYDVLGFDTVDMFALLDFPKPENFNLVIQDVETLHGAQFRTASLIVASPPCQKYSWMAMPWTLAKAKAASIRADTTGQALADLNRLFDACFRIQAQASLAAGRHIPMVVENVRGAQPWVGRARWNFGSFYLWGDVPALMPFAVAAQKFNPDGTAHPKGSWFKIADSKTERDGQKGVGPKWDAANGCGAHGMTRWTNPAEGFKSVGMNWSDPTRRGQDFTRIAGQQQRGLKGSGGTWFYEYGPGQGTRNTSSGSEARKAASAMIAKIPLALSRHIGAVYRDAA